MVRQGEADAIRKPLFAAVNHISRKITRMTVCYCVHRLQVILPQVVMCIFKVNNRNCFPGESRNRVYSEDEFLPLRTESFILPIPVQKPEN